LIIFFSSIKYFLQKGKIIRESVTWDCGYNFPSNKMQYSASSFAQPITDLFNFILKTKKSAIKSSQYFPEESSLKTKTEDVVLKNIYQPLFSFFERLLSYFSIIQQGKIQVYISYLAFTLLILLFWNIW
jgi:hypothetical protein